MFSTFRFVCPLNAGVMYHERMDYGNWYRKVSAPFRNASGVRVLNALDKWLVYLIAAAYLAALALTAFTQFGPRFWRLLLVPAITFALVTLVRAALNTPRPYEMHDIDPLIKKSTHGKSLPSRHVSSAVIIACALAWLSPTLGVVAFIACAVVCFTRIVGGVHFPRDVAAAVAIALACGVIGFVVVP